MTLPPEDAKLYFHLQFLVLFYANQQLHVVSDADTHETMRRIPLEDRRSIRDALFSNPSVIDSYVSTNPDGLSPDQLDLIAAWKQCVRGRFFLYRHLKKHSIFMSDDDPPKAYGVLGIHEEIEDVVPQPPPVAVEGVLLPWRDKIVYDGILASYRIYFGPGLRSSLDRDYRKAKATSGIVESLTAPVDLAARRPRKRRGPTVEELAAALDRAGQIVAELKQPEQLSQRRALAMLRAAISLAQATITEPANQAEWNRAHARLVRALNGLLDAVQEE